MSDLGKELHSQYMLSYSPDPQTQTEAGFHKIRVEVNHPRLDIRARTGYYWGGACSRTPDRRSVGKIPTRRPKWPCHNRRNTRRFSQK